MAMAGQNNNPSVPFVRNQFYKWQAKVNSHGAQDFPGKGKRARGGEQDDDRAALKRELAKLRAENEIVKKAAKIGGVTTYGR